MKLYLIGKNGKIKNAEPKKSRYGKKEGGLSLLRDEIMMLVAIESRLASTQKQVEEVKEDELLAKQCA